MSTVERTLEVDLRRKREEEERARKRKSVGDSRREEKKERKRRKMAHTHTHTRQTSSRIDQRRCKERYTRTHFLCGRQTVYRAWWTQS
tara:strand:- start:2139 stop:2402 length:264 start_codon:yes stop_codon:yes gene_type:complete